MWRRLLVSRRSTIPPITIAVIMDSPDEGLAFRHGGKRAGFSRSGAADPGISGRAPRSGSEAGRGAGPRQQAGPAGDRAAGECGGPGIAVCGSESFAGGRSITESVAGFRQGSEHRAQSPAGRTPGIGTSQQDVDNPAAQHPAPHPPQASRLPLHRARTMRPELANGSVAVLNQKHRRSVICWGSPCATSWSRPAALASACRSSARAWPASRRPRQGRWFPRERKSSCVSP